MQVQIEARQQQRETIGILKLVLVPSRVIKTEPVGKWLGIARKEARIKASRMHFLQGLLCPCRQVQHTHRCVQGAKGANDDPDFTINS